MKVRLLSGSCYIALLVGFFCLKIFLPYGDFYFDGLLYAFTLLGTFEMLRAMKEKTTKAERFIVYVYRLGYSVQIYGINLIPQSMRFLPTAQRF